MTSIVPMILVPIVQIASVDDTTAINSVLEQQPTFKIENVNWPADYPYKPQVSFKMAHNGSHLFVQFFVEEQEILANVADDNGEVWTDSCVEFFMSFGDQKEYYNAEFTCIGTGLLGHRLTKDKAEHASEAVMNSIKRYSSLGRDTFGSKKGNHKWEMLLVIPATAYWKEGIDSFSGVEARGNVYKCGDNLEVPHFVSWAPIGTEKPNFHVPQYFGTIKFEK